MPHSLSSSFVIFVAFVVSFAAAWPMRSLVGTTIFERDACMNYWLLKADPDDYGFANLERDKTTIWSGVHNPQALSFLRQMQKGDQLMVYHTGDEKQVVGLAEVVKAAYPDPAEKDAKLVVVDIKAKRRLKQPVSLATIKAGEGFGDFHLVRMPRLSVMPVPADLWRKILTMAGDSGGR